MLTDLEIAQNAKMLRVEEIAKKLGLTDDEIEMYGKYKAKIDFNRNLEKNAKVILVTAINPTPAGEGKSTTTIGLGDALQQLGKKTVIALREPSLGPVFGIKGGAAGGGYAQAVPMEDLNLHFTGDLHAITCANNLISAVLDNHIYQGNELGIDSTKVVWKRALDMNDRALRNIVIGLGGNGTVREDHFDITVASEIMAILCLATNLDDLKERIGKIVVAYNFKNEPVTVSDLKCVGAVAMVLKDAIKPNLIQTLEHTPVLVHGGPFANIAHGCNSIIATNLARELGEYVVTEAGFGADLGAEKFFNIKSRMAGITPNAVVVVATIRALKMHGGVLKENLGVENVDALIKGTENLAKHIENVKSFNLPYVVAINKFATDTKDEIEALEKWCVDNNHPMSLSDVWANGGKGAIDLANKVIAEIEKCPNPDFKFTYDLNESIEDKIRKIAKTIYGASDVVFEQKALKQIEQFKKYGWDKLAICMAKTPNSLTDNPKIIGRPTGFKITVREFKPSIGAGFIVALTGAVMTMPGLPKKPSAMNMDVIDGKIIGLF